MFYRAISFSLQLCVWTFLLINFSVLFVLLWSDMCAAHDKSWETVTPWYFADVTDSNILQWSLYSKMVGFLFLVNLITSHLSGLNDSFSPCSRFDRSVWSAWQSDSLETVRYMIVPSAFPVRYMIMLSACHFHFAWKVKPYFYFIFSKIISKCHLHNF